MRRLSLVPLGAVFTAVFVVLVASPAHADKPAQATIGQNCAAGQIMTGGTFTLTKVGSGQQITVNTQQARQMPPTGYDPANGGTASYSTSFDAPLASPPAVATVPNSWAGSFSLTSAQCAQGKTPAITADVSPCGMTPVSVAVKLTNKNSVWVKYTVTLSGFGAQTIGLSKNETDEVGFRPLARGSSYTLTVTGAGGTNISDTVAVPACQAPGPAPTTKPPAKSASPSASTTPGTELVAQTDPSASPESSADALPGDPANDDPLHPESRLLGSWVFWLGIALAGAGVGLLLFLYFNRDRSARP